VLGVAVQAPYGLMMARHDQPRIRPQAEAGHQLGVSAQTAGRWYARRRDGGVVGMWTARQGSRRAWPAELAKVRWVLERGADEGQT
jgi:hypothetical protein